MAIFEWVGLDWEGSGSATEAAVVVVVVVAYYHWGSPEGEGPLSSPTGVDGQQCVRVQKHRGREATVTTLPKTVCLTWRFPAAKA